MSSASAAGTISSTRRKEIEARPPAEVGSHQIAQTDSRQDSHGASRRKRARWLGQRALYRLGQGAPDVFCYREASDEAGIDVEDQGGNHHRLVSLPARHATHPDS